MNPLENLPPFYVGQKVVYIGSIMPKNSIHIVSDVVLFTCGCCAVAVNSKIVKTEKVNQIICGTCGKYKKGIKFIDNGYAYNSKSFRPLTESPFPTLTMSRVVEKESVLVSMN